MAAIHQLIDQIEDERLREEADALTQGRSFGLVFERHLPKVTPIYRARPRREDAVAVRGEPLECQGGLLANSRCLGLNYWGVGRNGRWTPTRTEVF